MPGRTIVAKSPTKFATSTQKKRLQFLILGGALQVAFLIIYGVFVRYDKLADASYVGSAANIAKYRFINGSAAATKAPVTDELAAYYPMFQDIHVMILVGFGFLMTFLKRYGFNSVGINMFLSSLVIQWGLIVHGCFHIKENTISLGPTSLLTGDFSCVGVLISYGCLLGKLTPTQMIVMAMIEVPIFAANEYVGLEIFMAKDVGGSIFLHIFGAYFGLFVSLVLYRREMRGHSNDSTIYHSEIFGMIGTLFLWMFWPSFNSAVASGDSRLRAVINTYIALAACAVVAFVLSSLVTVDRKFLMMHIQNSTIAGGVAVGSVADLQLQPWGAMLIGMISAAVSVFGYRFLTPALERIRFHDTAGVHNLHGMPGLISGISSAVCCALASTDIYGQSLWRVFPAMAPANVTTTVILVNGQHVIEHGQGRSASQQGLYQLAAMGTTLACAIVGGVLTGALMRLPCWDSYDKDTYYSDEPHWHRPEDGFPDRFTQMLYSGERVPEHMADKVKGGGSGSYYVNTNRENEGFEMRGE